MTSAEVACMDEVRGTLNATKHIHGQGILPVRLKRRLRAHPKQLMDPCRFMPDGKNGKELSPDDLAFGKAMIHYLGKEPNFTGGQVADVLTTLGYKNPERDFEVRVHKLTVAIALLRRGTGATEKERAKTRRLFPTWSEIRYVAVVRCGWFLTAKKVVPG